MTDFFIPIAKALFGGYFSAIGVYMLLLFAITRLGRPKLVNHGSAVWLYTALHAVTWCLTALAGAYVCCSLSPLPPYGIVGFPIGIAFLLTLVLVRNFRQLPGQMSSAALALNFCGIVAGTYTALYAHNAFAALRA